MEIKRTATYIIANLPSLVRQFSLIPPNCHVLRGERNRQPIRLDGTTCDWRNRRQPWRWMRRSSHSHWQQRRKRRLRHYRIRGFRRGLFTDLDRVLGSFRRRGGG